MRSPKMSSGTHRIHSSFCTTSAFALYRLRPSSRPGSWNPQTFPCGLSAISKDFETHFLKNGGSILGRCWVASSAYQQLPLPLRSTIGTAVDDVTPYFGRKESWQESLDRQGQPNVEVNFDAYASLLRSCGTPKALAMGTRIHDHMVQNGLCCDIFFGSLLVQMYALCRALEDAMTLFVKMRQHEVFLWNCMIRAHAQQGRAEEAFLLFGKMPQEGVMPDKFTIIGMLSACTNQEACIEGKRMHVLIQDSGLEQDVFVATALVSMYGKCGMPECAWTVFQKMKQRDGFSWSTMIAVYTQHDQAKEALELFDQMQQEGVRPSEATFVSVFDACSSLSVLTEGKLMHACMLDCGLEPDAMLGNTLVNMYSKCGSLEDARSVFEQMLQRDIVSWNSMIGAYAQHGEAKEALLLVDQLLNEAVIPSKVTFICILDACARAAALAEGNRMYDHAIDAGLESDIVVGTALVNMYGKCGSMEDAQRVFDRIAEPTVVSWTAVIAAFAQHGKGREALHLFEQMQQKGINPNRVTTICALDACASQIVLVKGKRIHACIWNTALESDVVVGNALINMYGKCGSVEDAWRIFDNMHDHDVVSWTGMIGVYAQHGEAKQAFQLFNHMQQERVGVNKVTLVCIVDACAGGFMLAEGKQMHSYIIESGFERDVDVSTALLQLYGKCSSLEDAQRTFDIIQEEHVVLWTALIGAYAQNGLGKEALHLLEDMQQHGIIPNNVTFISILDAFTSQTALSEGKRMHAQITLTNFESDISVGNALVNMYGKCSSLEDAWRMFDKMSGKDVVSWTCMIAVYAQNWMGKKALQLFDQMEYEGIEPNKVTFVCVLDACANCAAVARGEQMHDRIRENGFESDVVVSTALVNLYGKCGNVDYARCVFDRMPEKNTFSWSSMIAVYAQHGMAKEALQLFGEMQHKQIKPDDVTVVSLLTACSHAGLIDEGCRCFTSLIQDGVTIPTVDHYVCMIDLLGRSGRLDEAEALIHDIPGRPTVASLMALLGACRYQADVKRGERIAACVFELDPENPAVYVMLSNIYVAAGREDDAVKVISRAREKNLLKQVGSSSIEVEGKVHEFISEDDCSHPQQDMIHSMLQRLMEEMKKAGFVPKVLRGHTLCSHSERLAIAFGLISTPRQTSLLITKSNWVCPDCHSIAKLISKLTQRTIVMRDAKRLHKMTSGVCTCADYW